MTGQEGRRRRPRTYDRRGTENAGGRADPADAGGHAAKRQSPGIGREEQIRPHPPEDHPRETGEQS